MLPAEGWAPRCSAPRHGATPANKSRAAPCRIDSEWRQCEWKNRSKNGDRLEVTVQSDLGHQLRCTRSLYSPISVTNLGARRLPARSKSARRRGRLFTFRLEHTWPAVVRSAAPTLPSGWQEPLLRFHLGWQYRLRGIAKHTTFLRARRSRQTVAS